MENREKLIGNIKNILIAVLFISAVLLLSFFWNDISLGDLENIAKGIQEDDEYMPELSELTRPGQIEISFGSGAYTVISADWQLESHGINIKGLSGDNETPEDADKDSGLYGAGDTILENGIYDYLRLIMSEYLSRPDIVQEKIEESQYEEVMSYQSITAAFAFDIPFVDFLNNNGIDAPQGSSSIANITEISFSAVSSENLFIYDDSAKAYYRFVTGDSDFAESMSDTLSTLIDSIEETDITAYYTIENLAGIKNDTLIPVYQADSVRELQCSSEFSISDAAEVRKYEQMFFPSGLDFIRKITENKGSLIYTYGYNQKVLLLDEAGSISYTEEMDASSYSDIGFYEGLQEAVEYVRSHGGWSSMISERAVPYLSSVVRISSEDGKYNGYRYEFSIKLKGIPVSFTSGAMLSIDVYGSQITSYQRDIVALSQKNSGERLEVINAINVITEEYDEIGRIIADEADKNGEAERARQYTSEGQFENVTKNIDMIRFCLMRDTDRNPSTLISAWYIRVDGVEFWCSPDDGHILAWHTEEAG